MVVKTITIKVKVLELNEKAKSRAQQRFFGMVRAAQKGEGAASPEVAKVAGEISKKDAKDFAKTKHKGLPEKKKMKEDYVIEKEDSPYEKASSGALSGKTRSSGASKTEPKTGFGRKAHRNSAAMIIRAKRKAERSGKKLSDDAAADLAHKGWASSVKHHKSSMTPEQQKRRQKLADTPYKKLSKDEQDKDKVSAKAIMSVHDKQKKAVKEEDNFTQATSELKKTKSARDQRYKTLHKKTNDTGNVDVNENLLKKLIDREKRIMFHPGKTKEEYEELKKKIGSKKKHDKPAIEEATSFQQFMADTKAAKDRQKKKIEDRKKKDAQFVDTRKQGVKFYDKKGSGRIKSGKKIYD